MKILRIALSNFRGVDAREVTLSPDGVTVIEGPNEIGKSSLAEAIYLLFEELDSTGKRRVVATKPVGRDVGPGVEIDAECGPYRFTFSKRFLRERSTELVITAPRPENHTGREAHDRVQAILGESVDLALWKALRIQQGTGIGQADLVNQIWLSAALDRSAGEAPAGEDEKSLLSLVHEEYLTYWTETGRRKQEATQLERSIAEAETELERVDELLRQIEGDIESSVRFRADVDRLETRREEHRAALIEREARVDGLASLETHAAELRAVVARQTAVAAEAHRMAGVRAEMIGAAQAASKQLDEVSARHDKLQAARTTLAQQVVDAENAMEEVKKRRDKAAQTVEELRRRVEFATDWRELERLQDRLGRIDDAQASIVEEAEAAAHAIDQEKVDAIRARQRDVDAAVARASAAQPSATVEAIVAVEVDVDGLTRHLSIGEVLQVPSPDETVIHVRDVVKLTVRPGARSRDTLAAAESATGALSDALERAGAANPGDAEQRLRAKTDAERSIMVSRSAITDALEGETLEALNERAGTLRERVSRNPAGGTSDQESLSSSRVAAVDAESHLVQVEADLGLAEAALKTARTRLDDEDSAFRETEIENAVLTRDAERLTNQLAEARVSVSDAELHANLAAAQAAHDTAKAAMDEADARLKSEGAVEARITLVNAREAYARIDDESRQAREGLVAVQARLQDHGEDGLAEDRDAVITRLERLRHDQEDYQRRADARRLLYETFKAERNTSRRAYVAPLQGHIERLGSIVFGHDFAVDLDEESLGVSSRTLGGRTVPFDSLSVGAQEQIALISRLACAMIVAPEGGVPVILDDALGNSDPRRLEAMGAVLALAGRDCQIIVLTCQPDRYEFVGSATVVRLQ